MANDTPETGLVRVETKEIGKLARPPHLVRLHPEDAIPHRPIELVTEEEKRHEEQAKRKAETPDDFFKRAPVVELPLAPGAAVSVETMLGFLDAIEKILPPDTNYPILSSAKIRFQPGESRLIVEAGSHSVWTAIAIKATSTTDKGFTAMLPVRRAKNVLKAVRDAGPTVVIGVDEGGVCIGPHAVPFGGLIDDFPAQPVVNEWSARAAVPAFYFQEICDRILLARSNDFQEVTLQGALLDFEFHEIDGVQKPLCSAVATDGNRIHVLRLPQMMVDVKPTRLRALPPTCTISVGFFYYMRAIIQHEWAGLEFGADQVVAKGEDFLVVARAATEGKSSLRELAGWRKFNMEWPGYWLASMPKLEQVLRSASLGGSAEECRFSIDGRTETLTVASTNELGDRFTESLPVRRFDGAPLVDVYIGVQYLRDALSACTGGLARLAFNHDVDKQKTTPLVIRGEDEQFKAIIMPRKP